MRDGKVGDRCIARLRFDIHLDRLLADGTRAASEAGVSLSHHCHVSKSDLEGTDRLLLSDQSGDAAIDLRGTEGGEEGEGKGREGKEGNRVRGR